MALTIKHKKQLTIPNDPAALAAGDAVSSDWNDVHTVTGTLSLATDVTGQINLVSQVTGNLPVANLNGGFNANTPNAFWRGDGVWAVPATGGVGQPGGANTQVQYNSNGALGGATRMTWTPSTATTGGLLTLGSATIGAPAGLFISNLNAPNFSGDPNSQWGARISTTWDSSIFNSLNYGFTSAYCLSIDMTIDTGSNWYPGYTFGGKKTFSALNMSCLAGTGAGQKIMQNRTAVFHGMGDSALYSDQITFSGGPVGGDEAQGFNVVSTCKQSSNVDYQYVSGVIAKANVDTMIAANSPNVVNGFIQAKATAQDVGVVSLGGLKAGDWIVIDPALADNDAAAKSCTVSATNPAVITVAGGHGFSVNQRVVFSGTTAPTGIAFGTAPTANCYYVLPAGFSGTAFQVSATPGGAAVAATTTGTSVSVASAPGSTIGLPADEAIQVISVNSLANPPTFNAIITVDHLVGAPIRPATVLISQFGSWNGFGEQRMAVVFNGQAYTNGTVSGTAGLSTITGAGGASWGTTGWGPGPLANADVTYALGAISLDVDNVTLSNSPLLAPNPAFGNGAITSFGTITGGSGYGPGPYNNVALTGGTGTGATANITTLAGAVNTVTLVSGGTGYQGSDILSAPNTSLGGTGSGFTVAIVGINPPMAKAWNWIMKVPTATTLNVQSGSVAGANDYKGLGIQGTGLSYTIRPALRIIRVDSVTGYLLCGPSNWSIPVGTPLVCPVCNYADVTGEVKYIAAYLPGGTYRALYSTANVGNRRFQNAFVVNGWSNPMSGATLPQDTANQDAVSFDVGFNLQGGATTGLMINNAGNNSGTIVSTLSGALYLNNSGTVAQYPRFGRIIWAANDFNGYLDIANNVASGSPAYGMRWQCGASGSNLLPIDTGTLSAQPARRADGTAIPGSTDNRSRLTWPTTVAVGRIISSQTDTVGAAPDVTTGNGAPLIDMSQTWNNAALAFDLVRFTFTNTASAAASSILRFNNGASDVFKVSPAGATTVAGLLTASAGATVSGAMLTASNALSTGSPTTVTAATYTVAATDSSIIYNTAAANTTTLPAPASFPGRWLTVRTIAAFAISSASANVVPITGGAAGSAILAGTAGKYAVLQSDGTNWQIMAAN